MPDSKALAKALGVAALFYVLFSLTRPPGSGGVAVQIAVLGVMVALLIGLVIQVIRNRRRPG